MKASTKWHRRAVDRLPVKMHHNPFAMEVMLTLEMQNGDRPLWLDIVMSREEAAQLAERLAALAKAEA